MTTENKQIRLHGDISEEHNKKFSLIKGFYCSRNNGEVLERMVDTVYEAIIESLNNQENGGPRHD